MADKSLDPFSLLHFIEKTWFFFHKSVNVKRFICQTKPSVFILFHVKGCCRIGWGHNCVWMKISMCLCKPSETWTHLMVKKEQSTTDNCKQKAVWQIQTRALGGALMYHLQSTASVCCTWASLAICTDSMKPSGPLSSKSQTVEDNVLKLSVWKL